MGKFSKQGAKKPITKRWWFWTLVVFFVVGIIGNLAGLGGEPDVATQEPTISVTLATTVPTTDSTTEATEAEPEATSVLPFDVTYSAEFRNDTTGRWRKALVATSETIDKYAVDYYKEYFQADDEVHVIYNFTLNTVNALTVNAGTLFVNVTEYVKGEEHDAKQACGGAYYGQYQFDLTTGEMTYSSFE